MHKMALDHWKSTVFLSENIEVLEMLLLLYPNYMYMYLWRFENLHILHHMSLDVFGIF